MTSIIIYILLKFQGFGVHGGLGQPVVYPVALVNSFVKESVTPHHLVMAAPHVWGMKPTCVPVGLSLVLWMVIGHRGSPGASAGMLDIQLTSICL